jgi:cytochrome c553
MHGLALLALLAAVLAAPAALADDTARAAEIVQGSCFACHGADGNSASPLFPRLAGQHARYIERQLADYRSGKRKSSTMQPMVVDLSAADFRALGAYFQAQTPRAWRVEDKAAAAAGKALYLRGNAEGGVVACAGCHGADAGGTETLPRLAGQHARYTENQLRAFARGERINAEMQAIAARLSEAEMKAVAAYLSAMQ